ncbi:hypothetical protein JR316_0003005 [Psilocybe cubensis]|uniref:Uncharacterized protein n=2 Tax=Psilocybe cubensis TaxID=181762 RepID=A0ACB8H6B5_PSICU|nr:hypothetical protein JR316_0003005 [Psilocybe cubensis]KAH9483535.1 hypothetical protein JR316_0003005 [Psilocybe cubensis]
MDFFTLCIISASVFTLTALYFSAPRIFISNSNGQPEGTPAYQYILLKMKAVLNPPNADIATLLKERADSNQRLVRALNLSNTFVSPDPATHKEFVTQAQSLLTSAKRRGWTHFQGIALEAARWQITQLDQSSQESPGIPFDSFIQNVTLIVVLVGLLRVDKPIDSFSYLDVCTVAKNITTLWALSKRPEPIPATLLEQLSNHLSELVGAEEEKFPYPLNFVVPAWETLWRVVATTVAYSYNDETVCEEFCTFNSSPSEDAFRGEKQLGEDAPHLSRHVSIKSVVNEAMRLHPPSKRIARVRRRAWCPSFIDIWTKPDNTLTRRKHHADVERLLRCQDVWGLDAEKFRHSRHDTQLEGLPQEREESMGFVFGHGPLRCIAASWAPLAAAVISGAIIESLRADKYNLDSGEAIGGRDGWAGWSFNKI